MTRSLRSLLRPAWLGLRRLRHRAGIPVKLNGMTMRVDPAVSLPPGPEAEYEPEFFAAFVAAIKSDTVVLDVGANQGLYSIAAARLGARVTAFEPAPPALDILRRMVRINDAVGRVTVVPAIVGDKHGCLSPFHAAETAVGWASAAYQPPGTRRIHAPTVTLDGYCSEHSLTPGVVKIDVEGYELEVLRGMERLLREARPVILCALHPEILALRGQRPGELFHLMQQSGYRAFGPAGNPVDSAEPGDVIFRPL